jgi:hypothetical protein
MSSGHHLLCSPYSVSDADKIFLQRPQLAIVQSVAIVLDIFPSGLGRNQDHNMSLYAGLAIVAIPDDTDYTITSINDRLFFFWFHPLCHVFLNSSRDRAIDIRCSFTLEPDRRWCSCRRADRTQVNPHTTPQFFATPSVFFALFPKIGEATPLCDSP